MIKTIIDTVIKSINELIADFIKLIPGFIAAGIVLLVTRYVDKWSQNLSSRVAARTFKSKSLQILFIQACSFSTWIIGLFLASVLAFPGLTLGHIVTTLGLSSVAIGFAFQDIFKNFLAGILLLAQEPFSIGDEIIVDGYQGFVEQINIRTTTLRTYQGEKVLIPNANIFTSSVQIKTAYAKRRTDLAVGVDYNTPLATAQEMLKTIACSMEGILTSPEPEIDLVNFGDSSIDFVVRYWTLPQQKVVRQVQTKMILAIKDAFDEASISIPYPIRTLYYYDQEKYDDGTPKSQEE